MTNPATAGYVFPLPLYRQPGKNCRENLQLCCLLDRVGVLGPDSRVQLFFFLFFFFFPLLQYTIHTFKLKSSEFSGTISLRINFSYFWAQPPCCADSSEARSNPGVIFLSLDLVQPHSKQIYARIISLKVDVRMNKRARI